MAAKKKLAPLEPPDLQRCQAEKPNGTNFMTMGGAIGRLERCTRDAQVIVKERKPGKDGRKGSMSLCHGCLAQLIKQQPDADVDIQSITKKMLKKAKPTKEKHA